MDAPGERELPRLAQVALGVEVLQRLRPVDRLDGLSRFRNTRHESRLRPAGAGLSAALQSRRLRARSASPNLRDVGQGAGAVAWAPFPAPPRRTVQAVLPHTALRRSSPSAFGLCPPGPEWPGGDDGSAQGDQPEVV